jgi:hypothetical protein
LAALVVGSRVTVEGAYFNRSVGAPAYAGIFAGSVWQQDMLVGAGIALMFVAAALAILIAKGSAGIRQPEDDAIPRRLLSRIAAGVGVLAAAFVGAAFIRATSEPLDGLSILTRFKEGSLLVRPLITAPDFLLGVGAGWAGAAIALAILVRRQPAPRSQPSTSSA